MGFASGIEKLKEQTGSLRGGTAYKRLAGFFDEGSMTELDRFVKNGENPAEVITAFGTVEGCPVYAFAQNPEINSGAMGLAQAAKIKRVYDLSEKTGIPVVGIYDSKGAYLQEGPHALNAYGDLLLKSNNLSGVVPQISLVLGTCAGSGAILATCADVVIISGNGKLFLNAPFVLRDQKVGTPDSVFANGIAQVYEKEESAAIEKARKLITLLPQNNLSEANILESNDPSGNVPALNLKKPSTKALIDALADTGSQLVLSAGFAPEVQTTFIRIHGTVCGILATDPSVNDGRLTSDACVKTARFVRMCDAFSIPVITLLDTVGFESSSEAEFSGNIKNAALLSHAYSEATTVKITVITGNAFGSVYTVFAGHSAAADTVLAWPQAVISALNPQASATILNAERLKKGESVQSLADEYIETTASAFQVANAGYIDDIIEPVQTREKVYAALEMLSGKRIKTLSKKHSNMPL